MILACSDARRLPLVDESVQCIVTSPPYWGLRKYAGKQELIWGGAANCTHEFSAETRRGISGGHNDGGKDEEYREFSTFHSVPESQHGFCVKCAAWRGEYGLEPKVEMYVAHTMEILRELRRVLRKDGVLFLNIGDSYYHGNKGQSGELRPTDKQSSNRGSLATRSGKDLGGNRLGLSPGLKPKDLCLIPDRVRIGAQQDGWWVRSNVIWAKPNPMPESVTDRPTDAYENILMLTKSANYFWDAEAVREKTGHEANPEEYAAALGKSYTKHERDDIRGMSDHPPGLKSLTHPNGRNLRNVWRFPTQPYKGAHFATFPEELPRMCILAATSAHGACAHCGSPWKRILKARKMEATPKEYAAKYEKHSQGDGCGRTALRRETLRSATSNHDDYFPAKETVGWEPTCQCGTTKMRPCRVLDPFGGSATTGRVAIALRREAIVFDLVYGRASGNERKSLRDYVVMADRRTRGVQIEAF